MIFNTDGGSRLVVNTQVGTAQSGGDDDRIIDYTRVQLRGRHNNLLRITTEFNDWDLLTITMPTIDLSISKHCVFGNGNMNPDSVSIIRVLVY